MERVMQNTPRRRPSQKSCDEHSGIRSGVALFNLLEGIDPRRLVWASMERGYLNDFPSGSLDGLRVRFDAYVCRLETDRAFTP
jgi:hypothetical protein